MPNKDIRKEYDILLAYGDLHIPNTNQRAANILLDVIDYIQPDIILDGGDIITADCLSEYNKRHSQLIGLQSELNAAHAWLESTQNIVPKAKKILLQDNHFYRRLYDKMTREVWAEDLDSLQPDNLLRLKDFGWSSAKEYNYNDVLLFIHGDDSSGSSAAPVNRVRKLVSMNGISVVAFHSHTTGIEIYNHYNSTQAGIQLGTFEDINKAGYIKHPALANWTHSFGVFYINKKRTEFFFDLCYFINDKCVVNGRVFS